MPENHHGEPIALSVCKSAPSPDSCSSTSTGYANGQLRIITNSSDQLRMTELDTRSSRSSFEHSPDDRRQIGIFTASFLIFNRIIGTGIFATPSAILALTGSVGMSLIIWLIGTLIAMAGTAVYLEFGTAIPRNGGEKNYLEYVYTRPRFLATAMFASYALLLGWAAGNSVIFGEYILHAAGIEANRWNQRGIGFGCITIAFIIHATALKWGLHLQNVLGILKLLVACLIIIGGLVAGSGHLKTKNPDNFSGAFKDSKVSVYGVVTALYSVIWSYIGYSNANYSLSETRNPARTLKIAAPVAVLLVGFLYMCVNLAYFAAVPRDEILGSGRILAASFFRNVFGPKAERAMSVFVALSAFGNVLSVMFSQGRIIQELGREGVLPFSKFWASNKPFNSPAAGLLQHYFLSTVVMLAPPPGDAYNFLLNVIAYPLSVVNIFVAAGLIHIYWYPKKYPLWSPGIRATQPVAILFFLSNLFLAVAPYLPPPDETHNVYNHLPYYSHCVVGTGVFTTGALYWVVWAVVMPWMGKYRLAQQTVIAEDGWSRTVITRIPTNTTTGSNAVGNGWAAKLLSRFLS
ncbi:hypothetical protein AJ80_00252 [Polytolypa hystricis UAMH7299]|uniref:High affinity methionine permease n=1 Tax=Polytolypa hystricis (strain UAMH7299) TaxID=1447883 RepID=A0A2B7Z578_POLH7|nr:hypothetical protein AJ80_00252 [Polytolypa hystricis UAMH7299]